MNRRIFLVRHGETAWTCSGQHTGLTDLSLTDLGQKQAKLLGHHLKQYSFKKIWVSPLKRAIETCRLAHLFDRAEVNPDLVEWDYGKYEGMTHEEIEKIDPHWTIFSKGASHGESIADICLRADRMLDEIQKVEGDQVLISSAHIMRVITARWLRLPPQDGKLFILYPASISILGYERENPVIISWNDVSYLSKKD